jgi:hypothetical protein
MKTIVKNLNTKKNTTKKNLKKFKNLKPLNCSPSIKKVVSTSCMTQDVLLKIRDEYNKDHSDQIIATKPVLIWHELKMKLNCRDERCWINEIDDLDMRTQIKNQIFAPEQPPEWIKNKNEWLSNYDIDMVMKQYELKDKSFEYLATTPVDYDYIVDKQSNTCYEETLCKFDLKSLLAAGKSKYAAVFNLDKHTESGSHWISLFINVNKRIIMFFDSANGSMPKEINKFIKNVKKQGLDNNIHFKFVRNHKKHQSGGSECGVYSIHFIIEMLNNADRAIELFLYGYIPDTKIEKYRQVYFNTPEK